jgi:prolyl-tRNA synthetase
MLQSRLLAKIFREDSKDAQSVSHRLMLRAGYIKQTTAGVYSYLPLLHRVIRKISQIVREEMERAGAQELTMPALQQSELWQESGRWSRYTEVDGIMFAFKDRRGAMVCLGPTHEEVITDIVRNQIASYKELPKTLFQIQTKFRDEIRPRFGLMRAREFIMKDAYSFDLDVAGLDLSYDKMYHAYSAAFRRMGLNFRAVEADSGAIGGDGSREFMVLADSGEDTVIFCEACQYAANRETAESKLVKNPPDEIEMRALEAVHAPGIIGVEKLCEVLKVAPEQTTKTILYMADGKMIAALIRGDCEINEVKLCNKLKATTLRLATPEEIKNTTGAEVGYAGPYQLPRSVHLVADESVRSMKNFECGGNRTGYHYINVNFSRDLPVPEFFDFRAARAGDYCPKCQGRLFEKKGIEVGHIFKLGTKYSVPMACTVTHESGEVKPIVMGCYGIGISRIAAAAVEQSHDASGIIWPFSIAPYDVHLIGLNLEDASVKTAAEAAYLELQSAGLEVLFDDRDLRAGEKFADADLIGLPARVTMSKRSIQSGGVELKFRNQGKESSATMSLPDAVARISALKKGSAV